MPSFHTCHTPTYCFNLYFYCLAPEFGFLTPGLVRQTHLASLTPSALSLSPCFPGGSGLSPKGVSTFHCQIWLPGAVDFLQSESISCSVQFSHLVESDSLRPHEPQHARPPCPSGTAGVYPNPCPLSRWCHPTISSSVVSFSSCLQSFPASGSFQMSQLFTSGSQSIGVSASTSVLPVNTQDWSPLGWAGWISLQSKGLSRVFSNTTVLCSPLFSHKNSTNKVSY